MASHLVVFIGTHNPIKTAGVRDAFSSILPDLPLRTVAIPVSSGISNQPFSLEEITRGATNRVRSLQEAVAATPEHHALLSDPSSFPYFVGIEAGLVPMEAAASGFLALSIAAVLSPAGDLYYGSSSGWEYPRSIASYLHAHPGEEMATVMGRLSGDQKIREKDGAVGFFSGGLVNRGDLVRQSVQMALIPHLQPRYYKDFP